MLCYKERLIIHEIWQMRLNQFQLNKARFYYTREYDKVGCFCCNLTLFTWKQTVKPLKEDERLSSPRLYIKMIDAEATEDELTQFNLEWKRMRIKKLDFNHPSTIV